MGLMEAVPVVRPESRRVRTASLPSGQQLARQLVTTVRVAEVLLHHDRPARPASVVGRHRTGRRGRRAARGVGNLRDLRIGKVFASTVSPAARVNDRDQVAVEIRLYLPEQDYVAGRHVNTFGLRHGNAFGATLSVAAGAQWAGNARSTSRRNTGMRADTLEALVDTVAANVNAALGAAGFGATR